MKNWQEKKKLIAGVIALILALLGGGGYYTVNQGGEIVDNSPSGVVESIYEQEVVEQEAESVSEGKEQQEEEQQYYFRNESLLQSHYEKHGIDMGFASAQEYETAASAVISHPDVLHKIEAEDGDDVYYVEDTNEFVVVSGDGYIRTYFNPSSGIEYYNRQ